MPVAAAPAPQSQTDQTPLLAAQAPLLPSQAKVRIGPTFDPPSPDDDATRAELLKTLLIQSLPLVARGGVVAARYFVCAILLAQKDERLIGPNTLINLLESVYIIFGGRSLAIISSVISKLYGEIEKATREKNAEAASAEKIAACDETVASRNTQIGVVMRHGVLLAGTIGLPVAGLYYFANHHILRWLGQDDFAVEKARDYFQAAALGYFCLNFLTALQRLSQGVLKPMHALATNFVHSSLCILLSYLFLFGKAGFPQLELDGVGYAFSIAGFLSVLLNALYVAVSKNFSAYHIFSLEGGFQLSLYKDLAKKGLQTGLQNTTENIANMTGGIILGLHSSTALAATQMSESLALYLSIMSGGLGQAISVCVGKSLGAEKYSTLKQYGNMGIVLGAAFPLMAFIAMLFARQQFISLYVNTKNPDNAELVHLASIFLLIEPGLRQLVTAVQLTTATGGLLGLKDTSFTMKTSIGCSLGLNAAIVCLMHFVFHANSVTLFSAKAIGMGITALLNTGRWIMKSHEQSPQEKWEVQDARTSYRIKRSARLFVMGRPQQLQDDLEAGLHL